MTGPSAIDLRWLSALDRMAALLLFVAVGEFVLPVDYGTLTLEALFRIIVVADIDPVGF